jgi:hypothetical protein
MDGTSGKGLRVWIGQWGFSCLVGAAALGAAYTAWKVAVPEQVPDFALQAEAIYRIEVGAAAFLGLYLMIMAFVLALNNRGFSEIGVNGLKAQDMMRTAQQTAIQTSDKALEELAVAVDEIASSTERSNQKLAARLDALEADRIKPYEP